ncbi:MAG: hypothetical protein HON90_15695 [Halobacteriovoraceae bacterium]|nr:hypothetical protein [Halobacteriovoraceae bacterium]
MQKLFLVVIFVFISSSSQAMFSFLNTNHFWPSQTNSPKIVKVNKVQSQKTIPSQLTRCYKPKKLVRNRKIEYLAKFSRKVVSLLSWGLKKSSAKRPISNSTATLGIRG